MKKILTVLLALLMVLSLAGCGKKEEAAAPTDGGKKVLNVMSFTDEVPGMVATFMEEHPEWSDKYEVKTTIVATTDNAYQPALDQMLQAGGADAPDIYAAEAAFILKYAQGDASQYAAGYDELGIDVAKATADAGIAQYTIDIGTRGDGKLVGLGYQATGGAFIYRRSIAEAVFGSAEPAVVEEKIGAGSGNWDKFFETAAELKAAGYKIVSGDGDIWHAIENSSEKGWIVDGKLHIDAKREQFLDYSKELKDNGYHSDSQDWQDAWFADMTKEAKVLGFYGPAWLINYTLGQNCGEGDNNSSGDWAVCAPNIGFFWGGTWVLANKDVTADAEKTELVKAIIEWITLDTTDTGLQYRWANGLMNADGTKDAVASSVVMAKSNGEAAFLGGQNMFDAFIPAGEYANGKCLTQYDETINSYWRDQVRQYTAGTVTRDEAIANFKQTVLDNLAIEAE